jgi:hypothetical protein
LPAAGLIEQCSAFINQLRHALAEYYPTALEAFEDWGATSAWMFLQRFPTPQLLEKPVSVSGRHWECHQRWACDKYLRYAVHLVSEQSLTRCVLGRDLLQSPPREKPFPR